LLLLTSLVFAQFESISQSDTISLADTSISLNRKYVVWASPSHATHVYGVMFNFWPNSALGSSYSRLPVIDGVEINLNPIGLLVPIMNLMYCLDPKTHVAPADSLDSINFHIFKKVNGIQIGFINMDPTIINGIDINLNGSYESKVNGLTVSGIINKQYAVNGVTIASIGNHNTKCNGLQIGLINSCRELNGIQIGLWNKNQKRSLPIINWSF